MSSASRVSLSGPTVGSSLVQTSNKNTHQSSLSLETCHSSPPRTSRLRRVYGIVNVLFEFFFRTRTFGTHAERISLLYSSTCTGAQTAPVNTVFCTTNTARLRDARLASDWLDWYHFRPGSSTSLCHHIANRPLNRNTQYRPGLTELSHLGTVPPNCPPFWSDHGVLYRPSECRIWLLSARSRMIIL